MSSRRPGVVAVGLTGGIGAGKSTALSYFKELGAVTVSADDLVHKLYEEPEVCAAIATRLGGELLGSSGAVDRGRLAAKLKSDPTQLKWLEELTHPRVGREIERIIASAPRGSVVVCEVPLLYESGLHGLFDLLVTIEASAEARRKRSVHGFGLELFERFERRQAASRERVLRSHLVFVNDGSREELREFVVGVYERAQGMLGEE